MRRAPASLRAPGAFLSHLRLARLLASLVWLVPLSAIAAPARPNIVIVLADDMGYSDLGCYGGEIATPNLDALAKDGLRFTQFYNTARCCPTRASLLTGLYPHQAGMGHMMNDRGLPGYRGDLNNRCVTIAEALRPAGYRNYAVGKWHVTRHVGPEGPKHNWPLQRGFDRYYGTIHGAGSYFDPATLTRDNTPISPFADLEYQPARYYYTDAITDHAIRFVREHHARSAAQPFFLYVAYTAAHWPLHALPEDAARYRGRYDGGYAPVRAGRVRRMTELGLLSSAWKVSEQAGDWSKVESPEWEARCMEVYAAMVDRMDQGIGRLVSELKRSGALENTLLFYLQDNGGCAEAMGRSGTPQHPQEARGSEPSLPPLAAGALLPAESVPPQTRAGFPVLMGLKVLPGDDDTYIAYGRAWANVSNTPFREYKHWVHEGGISTPLIAHWPQGIPARRRGKFETMPGHLIDLLPTCLDAAGARYPAWAGEKPKPLQGVSLLPALRGGTVARKEPLFWEHEGHRAVRDGRWKLVAKEGDPWQLYDLEADRTEQFDLASRHPGLVQDLAARWDLFAVRCDVLPLGGWRAPPKAARDTNLSTRLRFELAPGARLARSEAPALAGRSFTVSARFTTAPGDGENGVIVAQGGATHGFSLYLKDGKLSFAVRRARYLTASQTSVLASGPHTVVARLGADGELSLAVDGGAALLGSAGGPLTMPGDGLTVGADEGGAVGDYRPPFRFGGSIESVRIELNEAPEPR